MSDGFGGGPYGGGPNGFFGMDPGGPGGSHGSDHAPFQGQRGTTFFTMGALRDNGVDPGIRSSEEQRPRKRTLREKLRDIVDFITGSY